MHGIIFAYNSGARLKELTEHRTVASIPFGGRYRVIDFMLSTMVNAGIIDIGVVVRDSYSSLLDHLGSGKSWDLSRKRGGLQLLPPFSYANSGARDGAFRGKMEALAGIANYISLKPQEYVVLADSDVIANLPLEEIFDRHIKSGADITAVCSEQEVGEPENAVYFTLGSKGRVTDVLFGNAEAGVHESLGVYILSKALLQNLISYCKSHSFYDFDRDVLQKMKNLHVQGYVFDGYAARLQSTSAYFKHNMELLDAEVRGKLFRRDRPVMTKVRDEASTYYGPESAVRNSLIADGTFIEGIVENSIIFRGVKVGKGAKVQNSILMQDASISSGAMLNYAIADKQVHVNRGRMLMGHDSYPIAIAKNSVV